MTAQVRFPVAPRPFRAELLSSWMTRVAARYGSEPLELMVYLAGQGGKDAGARQVDDVVPDMELLRLWAKACRIDPERLRRSSLASRNPDRPQDWFLTETVPVCLACFDADIAAGRDAYLRGHWRLAEQVVCPSHRTMLLDRCPACRGRLRPSLRMLNGLLRPFCRKCDAVLTGGGGEAEDLLKADFAASVLELQRQISRIVIGGSGRLDRLEYAIRTLWAPLPDPTSEPWPVMILLDEFDQLGPMPIVEQALKQLAGHGARVSIITQSIPGLDNIYGENVRMSLESAAGMKLYLAANDKKTAGEISDALGKTTKLSVSDSVSRDRDFLERRSVSRRMEERPLLTPDEVRRLNPDQAILIPERQNPLLVQRIVYFQDPTFKAMFEAQTGPLPYPSREGAKVQGLAERIDQLEKRIAGMTVVEFVKAAKEKVAVPMEPEPKLAAAVLARETGGRTFGGSSGDTGTEGVEASSGETGQRGRLSGTLTPEQSVAVSRMNAFSKKIRVLAT